MNEGQLIIDYQETLKRNMSLILENAKKQQKIDKAINYIKECMETTHKINDYWTNELVNGKKLLEILGDKE